MALKLNIFNNTDSTVTEHVGFSVPVRQTCSSHFANPFDNNPFDNNLFDDAINYAKNLRTSITTHFNIIECSRELLSFIIKTTASFKNKLQPTFMSHSLLTHFVYTHQIVNPHSLSNLKWLELLDNGDMLFNFIPESTKCDQLIRASSIVDELITSGCMCVTLMDGHGRMVYNILRELHNRDCDIDKYTFKLYDLDSDVDIWHQMFLPESVEGLCDDILVLSSGKLRNIDELPGIIYFNFCGIGSSLDALNAMLFKIATNSRVVFFSWCSRGTSSARKTNFYSWQKMISKMRDKPHATKNVMTSYISHHGNNANKFFTYKMYLSDSSTKRNLSQDQVAISSKHKKIKV